MYYIKIIVNLKKTSPDPLYSLHLYVDIKQNGGDLNMYPANWTKKQGYCLWRFWENIIN